ncbi:nucleic acid-binding protein [Whalleya microplaca]|nr:nucleic acid-binding protein [Whalleya microplaca]
MGRPKRDVRAAAEESTTPPDQLTDLQSLAKIIKAEGNSLYSCSLPDQRTVLVELAARFRNTIWIKRGGYVLVDLVPADEQKGKVEGEIVNVVREEKEWRKQRYWSVDFRASHYRNL